VTRFSYVFCIARGLGYSEKGNGMEAVMKRSKTPKVISLGDRYFASQAFAQLFKRGMDLIEETAAYLDGPGRTDSKRLDRQLALVYATESMRLTSRLMIAAAWLILMRAKKEGEMDEKIFRRENAKADLEASDKKSERLDEMPGKFADLIGRSYVLLAEIRRLNNQFGKML